jgi:hypothetical protein
MNLSGDLNLPRDLAVIALRNRLPGYRRWGQYGWRGGSNE